MEIINYRLALAYVVQVHHIRAMPQMIMVIFGAVWHVATY
jgi:hypothetical protein